MKELFKRFLQQIKNEENHGLLQSIFSLSIIQVTTYVMPLITLPYLIRVLGSEKYGLVIFALSFVNYLMSIVEYSFQLKATKEVAVSDQSPKVLSEIFSRVIFTKLFLFMIGILVITSLIYIIPSFKEHKLLFYITTFMVFGKIFYPFWFFQGLEKLKYMTLTDFVVRSVSLVLLFTLIKEEEDYIIYPLITSLAFCAGGIFSIILIWNKFKVRFIRITFKTIIQELKDGWSIFMIRFLPNLYNNSSVFLLGILASTSAVAFYDAGKKFVDAAINLNYVVTRSFFPFLNRKGEKFEKAIYYILGGGLILSLGLIIGAYPIYKIILTEEFRSSFYIILILSLSPFFISLDSAFGSNGLLRIGKELIHMKVIAISSFIGLILAIFMIWQFSLYGAAINLLLIRGLIGFLLFIAYRRITRSN